MNRFAIVIALALLGSEAAAAEFQVVDRLTVGGPAVVLGSTTVSGALGVGGSGLAGGTLVIRSTSATGANPVLDVRDNAGNSAAAVLKNGKVGVGTTVPVTKLDIAGDVQFGGGRWVHPALSCRHMLEERTRSGEDFCEGKGKAREQGRREGVVLFAGKLGSAREAVLAGAVDGDGLEFGVDDPVLLDSAGGVELVFDRQVRLARCLGEHLDDEVGGAGDILLGDDGGAGGGNEEQVRLDDVLVGQDDIHGGDEHRAEAILSRVRVDLAGDVEADSLVPRRGRGGHKMLSGDDLVALPVVGEEEVVLVGQPGPHAQGGGHAPSIARAPGACQYRAVFVFRVLPAAGRVGLRALLCAGGLLRLPQDQRGRGGEDTAMSEMKVAGTPRES